jgi:hypothetical protein
VWQSFLSIFPHLLGGTMATSQRCCHLPGEMLNSAAKCADRARIRVQIRVRFRVRFHAQFAFKPNRDLIFHLTHIIIVRLKFQQQQIKNLLAGHLWQEIVHRIVRRFVRKIARVIDPLVGKVGFPVTLWALARLCLSGNKNTTTLLKVSEYSYSHLRKSFSAGPPACLGRQAGDSPAGRQCS